MTRVATPTHLLTWDGLVLEAPGVQTWNADGYQLSVSGEDYDTGNPVPVDSVLTSLLVDGDLTRTDRWGNREAKFTVIVESDDDGPGLALGEAALMSRAGHRSTVTWTPPQAGAVPSILDVQTSRVDLVPNDVNDELQSRRTYTVTFTCLPWVRAVSPTTVDFTAATTAVTTINDAASASGWGFTSPTTPAGASTSAATVFGDPSVLVSGPSNGLHNGRLIVFSNSVPATSYVAYDLAPAAGFAWTNGTPPTLHVAGSTGAQTGNGTLVATTPTGAGYTRYLYRIPAVSGGVTFQLTVSITGPVQASGSLYSVGGLYSAAGGPLSSVVTASIGGAVRTTGSLVVSRSTALNYLTVYSDPSLLTNLWSPDNLDTWWRAPAGQYAVWIDSRAAGAGTETVVVNGQSVSGYFNSATTGTWFPVGRVSLTQRRDGTVGGAAGGVTVTRNGTAVTAGSAAGSRVRIFRDDATCSLTHIPNVTDTNVTIDGPSVDFPFGGLWSSGASIAGNAGLWQPTVLVPGMVGLFVDCDNVTGSAITRTLTYYKRGHTNMAEAS